MAAAAVGGSDLTVAALELDGTSYVAALEGLADVHRGETVLVVLPEVAAAALADAWGRRAAGPGRGPRGRRGRRWVVRPRLDQCARDA